MFKIEIKIICPVTLSNLPKPYVKMDYYRYLLRIPDQLDLFDIMVMDM